MNPFAEFRETIELDGESFAGVAAYRMDSTESGRDMRGAARLGGCLCCDFLLEGKDETIILIEDTHLHGTMSELTARYGNLAKSQRDELIDQRVRDENRLKAYGSLLVLCRLAADRPNVEKRLRGKRFHFWLVVTGSDEAKFLETKRARLQNDLKSDLRAVVERVVVITTKQLKKRLSRLTGPPE